MFKKIIILLLALLAVYARLGVDVSQLHSQEILKCMVNQGYTFISARAWKSFGGFDSNGPLTIANAQKAGMTDTSVYMFPCLSSSKPAASQVKQLVQDLKDTKYNRIWLDIETNPSPDCGWTKDFNANCNFLKELVQAVKSESKEVGIYASHYMWQNIFGSAENCNNFTGIPLWYAHYDSNPSFTDFAPFGSWKTPSIKQYKGTTSLCGGSVDLNYKP